MGKYMRKGKGAGKIATMEVSQGALGVKTRAKTLAIEKDRRLALARNASPKQHNQLHSSAGCVEPFQTSYLELRSRKLEKVTPTKSCLNRQQESPRRDVGKEEKLRVVVADVTECRRSNIPVLDVRTDFEEDMQREVVCSSRTPELSPKPFEDFPTEVTDELSTPRATPVDAQLMCSEFDASIENQQKRLNSGRTVGSHRRCDVLGQSDLTVSGERHWVAPGLSQASPHNARLSEVEGFCECPVAGEIGSSTLRKRKNLNAVLVSGFSEHREGMDVLRGASARLDIAQRQDRRLANHHHIMNRSYMRTNLFVDAEAIDELLQHLMPRSGKRGRDLRRDTIMMSSMMFL